jgi:hypothetical protein
MKYHGITYVKNKTSQSPKSSIKIWKKCSNSEGQQLCLYQQNVQINLFFIMTKSLVSSLSQLLYLANSSKVTILEEKDIHWKFHFVTLL